jgi:cyanophycin synthetase
MISMPGDRSDQDIDVFGEMAGKSFDRIVIREDDNRRGRKTGEIAGRLHSAVVRGGLAEDHIFDELDEVTAAHKAIELATKDDFVLLLIDKPVKVWESLSEMPGLRSVV